MPHSRDLTEGSILKAIARLGIPLIATSLLQSAFNLVDMFFVGVLGPAALAAVTVSGIVIALLITAAIGISIGTLALVARDWGARRYREAALVVGQSFHLSLLLSLLFGFGGWFLARPLLAFLGGKGEVLELAVIYFRVISAGAWTIFIFVTFSSALKGSGDAWTPFKVMALGVGLNCLLDPLLIFGWGPVPALGVPGSALATVLARLVTVAVIIYQTRPQRSHLDLTGAFGRVSLPLLGRILRIGFFSSVEMLLRSMAMIALLRFVSVYGTAALAAYGIGTRVRAIVLMPGIGLGYSSGILVGQNLGAGQPGRAHRTAWATWGIYQAVLIPLVVFFLVFAREVVGVFNCDPEVLRQGAVLIRYLALSYFFLSLILVFGKSLNGAGDTAGPMAITGFSLLAMISFLAWPGSADFGLGGIWKAILGGTALNGLLMAWWFQRKHWNRPVVPPVYPEAVLTSPDEPTV
jgi:putative MATE family efflux protein